jgi:hypothetical protein
MALKGRIQQCEGSHITDFPAFQLWCRARGQPNYLEFNGLYADIASCPIPYYLRRAARRRQRSNINHIAAGPQRLKESVS